MSFDPDPTRSIPEGSTARPAGRASEDYGPALRWTILWAALNATIAAVFGVPALIAIGGSLADQIRAGLAIGKLLGTLLAGLLVGLFLYGVLRCTILSTLAVRRRRGYPDRHWEVVRQCLRDTCVYELIALAAASGVTAVAILGRGPISDLALAMAGIVDAIFAISLLPAVFGTNSVLRHASVIPYFPSKVGEIETFARGEILARHVAELDEVARSLGLTPLSSFGWNDDMAGETLAWHDAATGLRTVEGLLAGLRAEGPGRGDLPGLVADLERVAHALRRAEARGIPFSLLLRHLNSTSAQEWEVRRGTCF